MVHSRESYIKFLVFHVFYQEKAPMLVLFNTMQCQNFRLALHRVDL